MTAIGATETADVLLRVEGACGHITLNRPRALNALTTAMSLAISAALQAWAQDDAVAFVLIDGAGERGLCAGGDIRALYEGAIAGNLAGPEAFFRAEYRLNEQIATFPKPYVALMDGIVMGGGLGVSAHGALRIVTERSTLAMPETGIGFVPDIGGTYLLGRASHEFGTYMALTSGRVGAADAIASGLADVFVASGRLPALTAALLQCREARSVRACVEGFAGDAPPGILAGQSAWIEESFLADTVEDILAALHRHHEPAARVAAREIEKQSPIALKVTLASLRRSRASGDLTACLQQEFGVSMASMTEPDFAEGVRAAVVDKDRNPHWQPARLDEVTPAMVARFFAPSKRPPLALSGWGRMSSEG